MKNRYLFTLLGLMFVSTLSVGQVTVKFQKPASWTNVSLYTWGPELLGGWPGAALSLSDGWYSYTFASNFTGANLIFNNGGAGEQTVDYVTSVDVCLKAASTLNNGGKYDVSVVPCTAPGIKVSFKKPESWEKVNLYAYVNNAPIIGGWPGVVLTATDGVYSYTFDASYPSVNIIFNNGTSQLPDLLVTANACFESTDGVAINTVDCSALTEIETKSANLFSIYPNQVTDKLNYSSSESIELITIFSTSGRNILSVRSVAANGTIDIKSLRPGMYFVSVNFSNGKKQIEKIIKN